MPRRPKGDLTSLIVNKKPSNKLCGVKLHKYFIKSLLSKDAVNQPGFAKDGFYTDLDQIRLHLVAGYERFRKQNAVGLRMFLEYGCWLKLAYELFRLKKWNGQNGDSGIGINGSKLTSAFVCVVLKC